MEQLKTKLLSKNTAEERIILLGQERIKIDHKIVSYQIKKNSTTLNYLKELKEDIIKPLIRICNDEQELERTNGVNAAPLLYGGAGVTPKDVSLAEIYDPFTFMCMTHIEESIVVDIERESMKVLLGFYRAQVPTGGGPQTRTSTVEAEL